MSRVQVPAGNVTLLDFANGLLSDAAGGDQEPVGLLAARERKERRPPEPMASTRSRYWLLPCTLYTLLASNRAYLESCAAMTVLLKPFGNWPTVVWER